jgi:alpha-galactosidase
MLVMKWSKVILLFLICTPGCLSAQYAQWTEKELTLDNGVVRRVIQLPAVDGRFLTTSYKPVSGEFHYFPDTNADFQFEIGGLVYSGNTIWSQVDILRIADDLQGDGAAVVLLSADKKVELTVRFLLYPRLPVIRKNLAFKNLTASEVALESVDTERFGTNNYHPSTFSWIYSDYGRRKSIGPYEGNLQDALIIVHDMNREAGIVIGNEASGVLKRTAVFWDSPDISAGLTHKNARFPFRKWLQPGEAFEAPQVFTMVYNHLKDPEEILSTAVPDFVRRHMGIRLSLLEEKPTFVYNTWNPFEKNINEELIKELAKAAADAGMKEFIIDDGWQDSYGDWGINYEKFPNGLKPVFDYIKSLGMKPGLWVSVGSASSDSKVFRDHPEWFVAGLMENLPIYTPIIRMMKSGRRVIPPGGKITSKIFC